MRECGDRNGPRNPERGIRVTHRCVVTGGVRGIHAVADIGILREHLEAVRAAGRDVKDGVLDVVQSKGEPGAITRRAFADVDDDIEDGAAAAADQLRLSTVGPQVKTSQGSAPGP